MYFIVPPVHRFFTTHNVNKAKMVENSCFVRGIITVIIVSYSGNVF